MATKGMTVYTHNGEDYTINDPNNADEFSTSNKYHAGEYAYYKGDLYVFRNTHAAGAWNNADVQKITAGWQIYDQGKTANETFARIDQAIPCVDYAHSIEWVIGEGINDSGENYESSYWTRMDGYIPLKRGENLRVVVEDVLSFELRRALYTDDYTLDSSIVIAVTGDTRDYTVTKGIAYARFAIPTTVYTKKRVKIYKVSEFDIDYQNIEESQKRTDETLERADNRIPCVDYAYTIGWKVGEGINDAGEDYESSYWTRINDYIPLKPNETLRVVVDGASGFDLRRALYKNDKSLVSSQIIAVTGDTRDYMGLAEVAYVKFAIPTNVFDQYKIKIYKVVSFDYAQLKKVSNAVKDSKIYTYSGDEINLAIPKAYKVASLFPNSPIIDYEPTNKTGQGIAIYGDKLFQFFDDDLLRIYNINSGELYAEIECDTGHGNTACFYNMFYDSDDEFPLVFVSDTDGIVNVLRVTSSASTVFKKLYFNPATYGYAPQFAIDNEHNVGYTVGNQANSSVITTAIISSWDMSSLTDNGNGTYTPEMISTFTVDVSDQSTDVILQGVKFLNGNIFMPSGGTSESVKSLIHVIDVEGESVKATIRSFPEIPEIHEMEDIEFYPNPFASKYDIVMYIRGYGYYKMTF